MCANHDEKRRYGSIPQLFFPSYAFKEAIKAKNKARQWIIKGATELENNQRSPEEFTSLFKAVGDIKAYTLQKDFYSMTEVMHNHIENVKKYSIGNCLEYAYMTMYELWKNNFCGSAEVYRIKGGDHAFVVLNRKTDSDPNDFTTWGTDAIVIDAWSDKVYYASEIPKKLKAYQMQYYELFGSEELKKSNSYTYRLSRKKHILEPRGAEETLASYRKWCEQNNITLKNIEPAEKIRITDVSTL